jgi:hypothetical protein
MTCRGRPFLCTLPNRVASAGTRPCVLLRVAPICWRIAGRAQQRRQPLLRRHIFPRIVFLLLWVSFASAKDIAVISNKATAPTGLSLQELIKVCKAETSRWPDGKLVTFVMREPGADTKIALEKIYGMSAEAVNNLITNVNHAHVNRPAIVVVNSDDAVIKKVESTPGAIGLVDVYSITSGVSVIKVGGKLPLESGYLLHGN